MKKLGILLIVVLLTCLTLTVFAAEEVKYDFRKTTWGMSKEQVKLAEKGLIKYRRDREGYTEYELAYEVKLGLYDYHCYYYFVEDKLYKCEYEHIHTIFDNSGFIDITEYKRFKKALIEKYGNPFGQDERNAFTSYGSLWNTPRTRIRLRTGSTFNLLTITYESRELKEWAEQVLEEKAKINF